MMQTGPNQTPDPGGTPANSDSTLASHSFTRSEGPLLKEVTERVERGIADAPREAPAQGAPAAAAAPASQESGSSFGRIMRQLLWGAIDKVWGPHDGTSQELKINLGSLVAGSLAATPILGPVGGLVHLAGIGYGIYKTVKVFGEENAGQEPVKTLGQAAGCILMTVIGMGQAMALRDLAYKNNWFAGKNPA